jgi:transcriptional regulator with XRE-family HTH domain
VEKATAEKAGPVRAEVEALVRLIDDEILRSRISKRKLEKILGQGQGYVASLTRGRIALKVGHVYDLAEALGLEPLLLLYRAAPKKNQERFLRELRLQPAAEDAAARKAPALTLAEVEEMVRKIVRQELGRLAGL